MKRLLIVLMIFISGMSCYGFENSSAQFPQVQFQSVNTLSSGTNHQYNITPVGSQDINGSQTPIHSPRRVGRNDDPGDPMQTPITDVPIIFTIVFLSIYLFYKKKQYEKLDLERMDCICIGNVGYYW